MTAAGKFDFMRSNWFGTILHGCGVARLALSLATILAGCAGGDGEGRGQGLMPPWSSSGSEDAGTGSGETGSSTDADTDADATGSDDLEGFGVSIVAVEANQAVGVTLAEAGEPILPEHRNASLLHGRTTLVRAWWAADDAPASVEVEARLELGYPDGTTSISRRDAVVGASRDDGVPLTWEIPPADVRPGMTYEISLVRTDGVAGDERFPPSGPDDLGVAPESMQMDLVIVPLTTPEGGVDFTPEFQAFVERRVVATYPLQQLEMIVRPPIVLPERLTSTSQGFDLLTQARAEDQARPETYYHLLLDMGTCCSGEDFDWAGTARLVFEDGSEDRDAMTRVFSFAPDFWGPEFWEADVQTMIHELGHNHGREHAPCGGPAGVDPYFPYDNAGIGVFGYDIDRAELIDPRTVHPEFGNRVADFMAYCAPVWWSDYSWRALTARVREVTKSAARDAPPPWNGHRLRGVLHPDGRASWSVVPAPTDASSPRAHTGSLRLETEDGDLLADLPVTLTSIADTKLRFVEANISDVPTWERFEVRLNDGTRVAATRRDVDLLQ